MTISSTTAALALPAGLYAFIVTYYHLLAPRFKTEKQRAYILSALSSGLMTTVSLPFVWTYAIQGLEGMYEAGQGGWMGQLGYFGVVYFGVYLFADLSLGYFRYPSQIGMLTGWVHHTVYIGLMLYCLSTRQSPIFLAGAFMELPTFDLAMSSLFPVIRHDARFLSSFFLVRILYNAILLADCLRPASRAVTDGSYVPSTMLFLAGCLHVSWFRGGLAGYLKRRRQHRSAATTKLTGDAIVDTATAVDATIPSNTLPPPQPDSPDESPLVTPRTPSITPFSLREAYLPTLAIPTLNLPKVAVPDLSGLTSSLPTRDLNFGFKDAVKQGWDDRRAVLDGMRLHLGGPRLRRRGALGAENDTLAKQAEVRVEEVTVYESD